jgi:hypothetical protein
MSGIDGYSDANLPNHLEEEEDDLLAIDHIDHP